MKARTVVLSAHVQRDIAQQLFKLFDAWCKAVKYTPDEKHSAQKTRDQISNDTKYVKLGFSVPVDIIRVLDGTPEKNFEDGFVALYQRKKNFIATWCIENGIDEVNVKKLVGAFPKVQPSLSLVSFLAFRIGLSRFPKEITPALPPAKAAKAEKEADRLVEALVNKIGATQQAAQNWPRRKRGKVIKLLKERLAVERDKKRKKALADLIETVDKSTPEILEQFKSMIEAEIG